MSSVTPSLSIVMPAYNEAACIESVVSRWLTLLSSDKTGSGITGKLIVVNDGSRDETGAILDRMAAKDSRLKVVHQPNSGHGAAVLRGYREAIVSGSEFVFQTDSDDQFQTEDFWKLWEFRMTSPFILGFREKRADALHRMVITKILRGVNTILFGEQLKDANVPFRLIRTKFLEQLLSYFPHTVFAPNIFLSVLAKKAGAKLWEIPIAHVDRKTGTVSIVRWKLIKVCFRCVKELAQFRLSLLTKSQALTQLPHGLE